VGATPWRFKSSHPHSQIRRVLDALRAQTRVDLSNGIALAAVAISAISLIAAVTERRSRKAEVERERADRREQFENERRHREEQLSLLRIQVEADLSDREVRRQKEQAAADEAKAVSRAHIRGGAQNVVHELRTNADVAKRCEDGYHVAAEAQHLSLLQWKNFKGQIAGLEAEAPELWQELEETYEALELSKTRGAQPPPSADLLELADRLAKAADG
jgi:hypothetical protein